MYTNSSLVDMTLLSPNHSKGRTESLERITPHCFVGMFNTKWMLDYFNDERLEAAPNYVIGEDCKIGLCVEEKNRSWCSSNADNDNKAITIECSSGKKEPYIISNMVIRTMVILIADICKRYQKNTLLWIPNKDEALSRHVNPDELIITVHRWFANKSCPGEYMYNSLPHITEMVNMRIENEKKEQLSDDMKWAIETGLFVGYGDGKYGPKDNLTREQLATVLRRYTDYIKE